MKRWFVIAGILLAGQFVQAQTLRPFTGYEKRLFVRGIQGHCLDVITTQIALNSGEFVEGNPIVRDYIIDREVEFMAFKAFSVCGTYLAAQATDSPKWRRRILRANILAGWTPALWNVGLMVRF